MLGADVGTALMTVVFSFDLSWLSPLLIFVGVVVFVSRESTTAGRLGRVAIGLGLITLALQLIVAATRPLTESPAVQALLAALPNEVMLEILVGALLTVLSYSSLAIVLLTATLVASQHGASCRSASASCSAPTSAAACWPGCRLRARRRRRAGCRSATCSSSCSAALPWCRCCRYARDWLATLALTPHAQVVGFHLLFNVALALLFIGLDDADGPLGRRAGSPHPCRRRPSDRTTSTRWRSTRRRWRSAAPRARRCTRPTSSRRCCAAC